MVAEALPFPSMQELSAAALGSAMGWGYGHSWPHFLLLQLWRWELGEGLRAELLPGLSQPTVQPCSPEVSLCHRHGAVRGEVVALAARCAPGQSAGCSEVKPGVPAEGLPAPSPFLSHPHLRSNPIPSPFLLRPLLHPYSFPISIPAMSIFSAPSPSLLFLHSHAYSFSAPTPSLLHPSLLHSCPFPIPILTPSSFPSPSPSHPNADPTPAVSSPSLLHPHPFSFPAPSPSLLHPLLHPCSFPCPIPTTAPSLFLPSPHLFSIPSLSPSRFLLQLYSLIRSLSIPGPTTLRRGCNHPSGSGSECGDSSPPESL